MVDFKELKSTLAILEKLSVPLDGIAVTANTCTTTYCGGQFCVSAHVSEKIALAEIKIFDYADTEDRFSTKFYLKDASTGKDLKLTHLKMVTDILNHISESEASLMDVFREENINYPTDVYYKTLERLRSCINLKDALNKILDDSRILRAQNYFIKDKVDAALKQFVEIKNEGNFYKTLKDGALSELREHLEKQNGLQNPADIHPVGNIMVDDVSETKNYVESLITKFQKDNTWVLTQDISPVSFNDKRNLNYDNSNYLGFWLNAVYVSEHADANGYNTSSIMMIPLSAIKLNIMRTPWHKESIERLNERAVYLNEPLTKRQIETIITLRTDSSSSLSLKEAYQAALKLETN